MVLRKSDRAAQDSGGEYTCRWIVRQAESRTGGRRLKPPVMQARKRVRSETDPADPNRRSGSAPRRIPQVRTAGAKQQRFEKRGCLASAAAQGQEAERRQGECGPRGLDGRLGAAAEAAAGDGAVHIVGVLFGRGWGGVSVIA